MERVTFGISGMSCDHCVARVRKALEASGVQVENVAVGTATVAYDPAVTSPVLIANAITNAGYAAQPADHAA